MTEACAGRHADFGNVRWYTVPGSAVPYNGEFVSGYWSRQGFIVLAESLAVVGRLVRHEMLHAILNEPGHARSSFLGSCAGIVNCTGGCARDAGKWVAPSTYTILPADSLEITASAVLNAPEPDGQRWVSFSVRARNRGAATVFDPGALQGFGYIVAPIGKGGLSQSEPVTDSSTLYFAADSYKDWSFDFLVAEPFSLYTLPKGEYLLRGGFAQKWSEAVKIDLSVTGPGR